MNFNNYYGAKRLRQLAESKIFCFMSCFKVTNIIFSYRIFENLLRLHNNMFHVSYFAWLFYSPNGYLNDYSVPEDDVRNMETSLTKNFICILSLFYCYHTYFNPILILSRSILLLFSLIKKIDHLFYCCFAFIETLFYKQWSILSLFYYSKPQNSR